MTRNQIRDLQGERFKSIFSVVRSQTKRFRDPARFIPSGRVSFFVGHQAAFASVLEATNSIRPPRRQPYFRSPILTGAGTF